MKRILLLLVVMMTAPAVASASHWDEPGYEEPYAYPEFSGRLTFVTGDFCDRPNQGTRCTEATVETIGEAGWHRFDGDVTDERLSGEWQQQFIRDQWRGDHDMWYVVTRVEDEAGAWQGRPIPTFSYQRFDPATVTFILDGEGTYEGLTAMVEADYVGEGVYELRGRITDVWFPPLDLSDGLYELEIDPNEFE